jgi:hypothetical protein
VRLRQRQEVQILLQEERHPMTPEQMRVAIAFCATLNLKPEDET